MVRTEISLSAVAYLLVVTEIIRTAGPWFLVLQEEAVCTVLWTKYDSQNRVPPVKKGCTATDS